jgi:thymidylate synthase (FAD)
MKMYAKLNDVMGTDIDVVNAARVSFAKKSSYDVIGRKEEYDDEGNVCEVSHITQMRLGDRKLLQYLADHNHWSPFSHCYLSFTVKAPIFVARQLQKHTVGLAWNEVSRRYVNTTPEFYIPDAWRGRADDKKQGSSDTVVGINPELATVLHELALVNYTAMIDAGVCAEQARMVLPQSMYTEWVWSGSLYAFLRVCKLRLDAHTQKETSMLVQQIADVLKNKFPESWRVFNG